MINQKEITAVELSPTKKDFYQIWNELIDTAGKLSERWDPSSTNESDPGIVLLKVLTAVADKLNFTIDSNILENFMPSAAQEESMRKLCEMLGYDMKYYRSATTEAKITYNSSGRDIISGVVTIDAFTNLKDIDGLINYVTLEDVYLNANNTSKTVTCIEGEIVDCETDDNNIVSLIHLDDNNRYFLPETQIAENGIFITNIADSQESDRWERVTNLNTRNIGEKVFKVGFDSKENLPYIQFPEDINTIIEDGLKIKYIRTKGASGNISVNTLCKMEAPASWSKVLDTSTASTNTPDYYNVENYAITNIAASTNGANIESINDAYNSYKKTIGTFDTLVTCRDYINKIYQMTVDDSSTQNLVSNVVVADIRDDINKAVTLCTFTERGIEYKTMAKPVDLSTAIKITKTDFNALRQDYGNLGNLYEVHKNSIEDNKIEFYARCIYNGNTLEYVEVNTKTLTHFDLLLYPFKPVYGLNSKLEYVKSFKYDDSNLVEIKDGLEKNKTLAHNFVDPNKDDVACIKNYYRLRAKITTVHKVNAIEQADILGKVYSKLYENFNMRRVDFGEELPYDSILKVIETADTRIKNVSLEDPQLVTKFCTVGGGEFMSSTTTAAEESEEASELALAGNIYYNKLVLNNVLAGRVPLFNYDENFKPDFTEIKYPSWIEDGEQKNYKIVYPDTSSAGIESHGIYTLASSFEIDHGAKDVTLNDNEVVQFRLPNLKTIKTYPAYVNYYIHLTDRGITENTASIPATMQTLLRFMEGGYTEELPKLGDNDHNKKTSWETLIAEIVAINSSAVRSLTDSEKPTKDTWSKQKEKYHAIFTFTNDEYIYQANWNEAWTAETNFYVANIDNNNIFSWYNWVANKTNNKTDHLDPTSADTETDSKRDGIFIILNTDITHSFGLLVDNNHVKYKLLERANSITSDPFTYYYVQRLWYANAYNTADKSDTEARTCHTKNGLGQNGIYTGILANTEYRLKAGEYLLINYTSSTSTDGNEVKTRINKCYEQGEIIKPNFDLIDSELYHSSHSYTKLKKEGGYNFIDYGYDPDGLFTLGTDQQIEIRDFVKVELDTISSNIYWSRNDEIPDAHNRIYFEFDSEPETAIINGVSKTIKTAYTLKDGEYFYYTDANKTDIAFYGAGTKIKVTPYTPRIYKYNSDNSLTADDITTYGLSAAIPWRAFDFSKSGGVDKKLTLIEYQYINLISSNILNSVVSSNTPDNDVASIKTIEVDINGEPQKIKAASYTLDDGKITMLPTVSFDDGSNTTDTMWEVSSRLEFNVGQKNAQTLHKTDYTLDTIKLYNSNKTEIVALSPKYNDQPLVIKTNKVIQSSSTTLSVTTKKFAEDGHLEQEIPDLQIKVLAASNITKDSGHSVNLNNFGEANYTKLNFNDSITNGTSSYTTLNAVIPGGRFGLLMLYNIKVEPQGDSVAIRLIKANPTASISKTPKIYNYTPQWWTGTEIDDINPSGYGHISTNSVWAVEGTVFHTLSREEFNALRATGNCYRRSAGSRLNLPKRAYYYFADTDFKYTYYKYDLVAADAKYSASKIYGTLYSVGEDGESWAQEAAEGAVSNFGTISEADFNSKKGTEKFCERTALDPTTTLTPEANKRFDYIDGCLYTYIAVLAENNWNAETTYTVLNKKTAYTDTDWTDAEVNPSGTLTEDDYLINIYNGMLVTCTEESCNTRPSVAELDKAKSYIYDDENKKLYTYTKIVDEGACTADGVYGTLLDSGGTTTLYHLRKGLNIVEIDESCKIEIYPDTYKTDTIVFGNLDIVYETDKAHNISAINKKLAYKRLSTDPTASVETQILSDIKSIDTTYNFYYNALISNTLDIDMNNNDDEDTLENPINWYDKNNVNNKFVVSEIDTTALLDNVVIAKSSRRS